MLIVKDEERCAVLGEARACMRWVAVKYAHAVRETESSAVDRMLDPIHKPKLPIAKAALVGGAGT
jgi:hypothetical protein